MKSGTDEKELIHKLVFSLHLSVPERNALPEQKARASLICLVLEEALQSGRWFHAWWLPDDSMIGCEIKYRGDGAGQVCWTYSGIEGNQSGVRAYISSRVAAQALMEELRRFTGNAIDGVPIDWSG